MEITPRMKDLLARLELDELAVEGSHEAIESMLAEPGFGDDVRDLESVPFVTIDNPGSRDLDQALHVTEDTDGWTVTYALADASYYIRPGTPLFDRSVARGTTFYFPSFAIPMLPPALSEGLISLNPDVIRRALVFAIRVNAKGDTIDTEVFRARIRSRAKLTYEGVQRYFDGAHRTRVAGSGFEDSLIAFSRVGERLRAKARERGMIEFDRTEAEVSHDIATDRFSLEGRKRNDVERWNEQISLLCNTEGARLLRHLNALHEDLQAVYRVHLPPMERRLSELREILDGVVARHQLSDAWLWDGDEPLAHYLDRLPDEPTSVRKAIDRQVRYTNRASEFSDRVGPHYALAVGQYARFSSPMREVVGIFTHKELIEVLGMDALESDRPSDDETLRQRVIDAANRAKQTQKQIDKEVLLMALHDQFEDELAEPVPRTGTIVGVRPTRLYISLNDLPVDIKIYLEDVEKRFGSGYRMRGSALATDSAGQPSFGIGDVVRLEVERYDEASRRWHFRVDR